MTKRAKQSSALLLGVLAIALCYAQGPVVVRLRDAVGDTIDLAERDSFHLFPNTKGFRQAVILALPGPEFFAEIERAGADSTRHILFRIMPTDLERIRFLIDNREYIAAQQRSDTAYARALASFWQMIEEHPLRNMAGEPAIVQKAPPTQTEAVTTGKPSTAPEVPPAPPESVPSGPPGAAQIVQPAPPEAAAVGKPTLPPVTGENRYSYTLHGATLGSIAGGIIGSWTGIGGAASIVLTVAGSYAGYEYGDGLDRMAIAAPPLQKEGQSWRTCCALGACIPGIALGATGAALIGTAANGRLSWASAVLSGVCVTVEIVTLGYRMGRSIDQGGVP